MYALSLYLMKNGYQISNDATINFRAASTRVALSLWFFFALIIISSYTANLAAFLTMSRMGETIENAEDLAKQQKIKYGTVKGGSTMQFFKESNFSTYQRMWSAMESFDPSPFLSSNQEGKLFLFSLHS